MPLNEHLLREFVSSLTPTQSFFGLAVLDDLRQDRDRIIEEFRQGMNHARRCAIAWKQFAKSLYRTSGRINTMVTEDSNRLQKELAAAKDRIGELERINLCLREAKTNDGALAALRELARGLRSRLVMHGNTAKRNPDPFARERSEGRRQACELAADEAERAIKKIEGDTPVSRSNPDTGAHPDRLEVIQWFSSVMLAKLEENREKGTWLNENLTDLYECLKDETLELWAEIVRVKPNDQHIAREAADVANFAMFIADKYRRSPKPPKPPQKVWVIRNQAGLYFTGRAVPDQWGKYEDMVYFLTPQAARERTAEFSAWGELVIRYEEIEVST